MSNKVFDVVQLETPNRNAFDLTHDIKTSFNMGDLIPVSCMEVIPGDNYTIGAEALIRFAPLVAPVMHRFDSRIEYFFVPNRLVWKNWVNYISNAPGTVGLPAFPTIRANQTTYTKLMDYFGIPTPNLPIIGEDVNAIPFAAFQLIYDQYYRDQNLVPSVVDSFTLQDGDNTARVADICANKYRAWEHDYFTSCLPFAQKGNPVTIGTVQFPDVPVKANADNMASGAVTALLDGSLLPGAAPTQFRADVELPTPLMPSDDLFADTSSLQSLSITINEFRDAVALQKWLEINARAGTRINEIIQGHFNIRPDDQRIQRPEYIVGVKSPVQISEVLSTSGPIDSTVAPEGVPQGNMAGHGIGVINDQNFGSYFAKEHGFIIGIMSIMPKTSYQQGLEKFWLKTDDVTQYFWPTMANVGEQPVLNKEIYAFQGATGRDTFGYLPAHQDYRFISNRISGNFRNDLSYWTCARIFASAPALNADFITASDVRKDIFAVTDPNADSLYVQVLNKVFCSRLIPQYGTPGLQSV